MFHSLQQRRFYVKSHCSGVALVITLALVTVLVLILVAFVSIAQLDRTATASYSQSMRADQLAQASLNLLVAQLRMEMSKDAPGDTGAAINGSYPNAPVYTNVTSANIEPQAIVANTAFPTLVKTSTNAPFFTGNSSSQLEASTNSTTTASQNGRSVSPARWGQSYFGTGGAFFSNAQAPYWVIMTRSGATNAKGLGFGATGNTLNNAAAANANYAIGRFAYAIYNEGGLLDVTVAGTPTGVTLTTAQQDLVKGMLAGADLTQMNGTITNNALTTWRNPASGVNVTAYTNALIGYAATNAAGNVYPGDTTFLSRQDLINAAVAGTAGFSTNALPNLTTFTRELNQPSWAPSVAAPGNGSTGSFGPKSSAYVTNAVTPLQSPYSTSIPNPNPLVPLVRVAHALVSYQYYNDGGTLNPNFDPIVAGDPVVRRRFSLARLAWLGKSGPANGATATAIQACFGLMYVASLDPNIAPGKVWQYVGPIGSTEQTKIKTLYEVAQENPPREPNFFELLQAGILAGSLAADGGVAGSFPSSYSDSTQRFPAFQILRIGANIICQYNTDQYPRFNTWQATDPHGLPPASKICRISISLGNSEE